MTGQEKTDRAGPAPPAPRGPLKSLGPPQRHLAPQRLMACHSPPAAPTVVSEATLGRGSRLVPGQVCGEAQEPGGYRRRAGLVVTGTWLGIGTQLRLPEERTTAVWIFVAFRNVESRVRGVSVGIVAWGRTRPVECSRNSAESEAKRLELERKLMEYVQSDAYQIKMKRMKLQKYLKEIEERQKRARVRNQALLKEFDEFEAHLKTSNLEMSQKMEAWYERELKRASSLQEGGSSAAGDEEGAAEEQVTGSAGERWRRCARRWEARGSGGGAVRGAGKRGGAVAALGSAGERWRRCAAFPA
ncbi:kizuna centrosomal protein [Columba livia]|uniref:Centrosomal protein kizuna n=1 Tax=Columba livia TaxID=8932 RepID=A0A2I0M9B7_COLLI|nr:kizuna centrosomal protein [Columba livia]